jgi:hypothetical protein
MEVFNVVFPAVCLIIRLFWWLSSEIAEKRNKNTKSYNVSEEKDRRKKKDG